MLISDVVESRLARDFERVAPSMPRVVLGPDGPSSDPSAVEVAYFSHDVYPERTREFVMAVAGADRLRWLHSMSAGVDHPWFRQLLERGTRLTNSSGATALPIAHTVMLYLLALSRDLPGWLGAQAARRWQPHEVDHLAERTLGVVGLGPIGLEVARLGQAFGMRVIGLRRTPRGDEPCETWPLSRRFELFEQVDDLVLAVPLTPETHHLIDAEAIARIKPGARIVNVARGAIVDETALMRALASGHLGGAGLDVFETEPLPADSPLWGMPNVIVTPHGSGQTPSNADRASAIFLENLAYYQRGEPMVNEIRLESE